MNRPGKPVGPHYLSHQTLDTDHGIILAVTVTSGDVNDSVPYLDQMEYIHKNVIPIQTATADAAYDFSLAHRVLDDMGVSFFVRPQARPNYSRVILQPSAFHYDKEQDIYICPNGKTLRLTFLLRGPSGLSLQYHPDKQDCLACPLREQCMTGKQQVRKVERSYFRPSAEKNFSRQNEQEYTDALRKRQIWCEGTFAAQKRGHNLRYLFRRGLEAAEDHCLLSATAMNLKRMIQAAD